MVAPRFFAEEEFKVWARNDLPTDDNAAIIAAILAAEQSMDNACHRRFELAARDGAGDYDETAVVTRRRRPYQNSTLLFIPDCVLVTEVAEVTFNDTVVVADTDWQLEPLDGRSPSDELVAYDSIRCHYRYWYWNGGIATISVTGLWGWPAIPPGVVEAVKVLTKAVLNGRDIRNGIVGLSPDGFALSERESKVVSTAIADYSLKHALVG